MRCRVECCWFSWARTIYGGVQPVRRELPTFYQEFPGPFDSLLLEVVAKAPVPKHLKKCVVVGVESDVIQIVVFTTCANALLGVSSSRRAKRGFLLAQKVRNELIHTRILGQKSRRSGEQACPRHNRVSLFS